MWGHAHQSVDLSLAISALHPKKVWILGPFACQASNPCKVLRGVLQFAKMHTGQKWVIMS